MHIGINLLYLIPGKVGGTETYARELIFELKKNNQLTIFCGRETTNTIDIDPNLKVVELPMFSSNRFMRILLEQTLLPILSKKYHVDVLFSLGYSAPVFHSCLSVVTIHDLNWYYHPEDFSMLNRIFWKYLTIASAKFSNHIITDSSASAESIVKVLGINPSKVTPILHGTPKTLNVKPFNSKKPYIFTVLADYPHKNLRTLLKAFEKVVSIFPEIQLYICGLGKRGKSTENIKYFGYVSRIELCSLYKGASIFVFPSAYEGFGYPVLEAMSYGIPVVSSNAFSLAEVVGNGGVLVEPYDIDDYLNSILKILRSEKYQTDLVTKGKKRVSELRWDVTAKKTLKVLYNNSI